MTDALNATKAAVEEGIVPGTVTPSSWDAYVNFLQFYLLSQCYCV